MSAALRSAVVAYKVPKTRVTSTAKSPQDFSDCSESSNFAASSPPDTGIPALNIMEVDRRIMGAERKLRQTDGPIMIELGRVAER
jgi:hypothetical protein